MDIISTSAFDIKSCLRRVQSLDMEALNLKVRKRNGYDLYSPSCGMFLCYTLGGRPRQFVGLMMFFMTAICHACNLKVQLHYIIHSLQKKVINCTQYDKVDAIKKQ